MATSRASFFASGAQLFLGAILIGSTFAATQQPGQLAPAQAQPPDAVPAKPAQPAPEPNQQHLLQRPPAAPSEAVTPPIQFESHGLQYESITRGGVTLMCAVLPPKMRDYSVLQVTITNGSLLSWTVKAEDFKFMRADGMLISPSTADDVVESFLDKASRNDVIKLQLIYESTIYALSNFRSTNDYEKRREAAMAQFINVKFKAAAEASAIALVPTKLKPGDSADGAVFFPNQNKEKTLGAGRLNVHTCGESFDFDAPPEPKGK
ncbi:MAG: hypothetical protein WA324_17065 [Bryobacteraceae bacterium]